MSFTVRCPYCGGLTSSSVSNGSTVCSNCGKRITVRNGQAKFKKNQLMNISFK